MHSKLFIITKTLTTLILFSVSDVPKGVFGTDESTWCNKVLVPNGTIKNLVKKTGYPENRIAIY